MSNDKKYYISSSMKDVANLIVSGTIIQTFFGVIGFSGRQIGTYTSLAGVVQIVVMIVSLFLADRISNVRDTIAFFPLSRILICLAMLPACFTDSRNINAIYYIALLCCCIQNLFVGFSGVLNYRFPYLVLDMKEYARIENNNGIFMGIFGIVVSGLITFFSSLFPFRHVMAAAFILSIGFSLCSAWLVKSMKINKEFQEVKGERFAFHKLWKHEFYYFYAPNFLRGIASGLMGVMTVVCMKEITTNASVVSGMATISASGSIAGCVLYQALRKKLKTADLYMLCSIVMFLFLPLMLAGKAVSVFCICYFIVCMGLGSINVSGAVYATEFIQYNEIGTYTSVRLIVMTLGQALANYAVVAAMDYIPTVMILILCGLAQLVSGILYFRYEVKYRKKPNSAAIVETVRKYET